jgi:3-deoxy-D-manno-octulosonic-acid transferase
MRFFYNILFPIGLVLSAPFYFLKMWRRGNWQKNFEQRFGRHSSKIKQRLTNRDVLWLHAVSVGEVNICTQLIHALEPRAPNLKIVVSTTTSTGMGELERKLPQHIEKIYYPIDGKKMVRRALAVIHPLAIVLVEAELWPNFLWQAIDRDIPLMLVNARVSERSFRGYKRFGFLFRPIFEKFSGVGCQNETDAGRLRELGFPPEKIHVFGNLKFDAAKLEERRPVDIVRLLSQLGIKNGAPILVAGSTHAGEEAILADIFLRLRKRFPDLFLVLVPRHFERGKEVGNELETREIKFVYRTNVTAESRFAEREVECLLVNTTGELKYFYEHASVVFVGKSLSAEGGQSPIEPGALGKAMIYGPNMQNFAAISEAFVKRNGAVRVRDAAELEKALDELLADENRRKILGENALAVVRENLGAITRTVDMILENVNRKRET